MRIYLHLTPNRETVPFNYQQSLVGAFHKWLGENELHDDISLYSLSWLSRNGRTNDRGIDFPKGSTFFISTPDPELSQKMVQGIFQKGENIRWGMKIQGIDLQMTPQFGNKRRFLTQSPIFIKRWNPDTKEQKYYFWENEEADDLMTETLHRKLERVGLSTDVKVFFDKSYYKPNKKMITFNGVKIQATYCPVIVEGDPRAVQFAWEVGVGNSTGIGFGALQ